MSNTLQQVINFPDCLQRHRQLLITSNDMNNSTFVLTNLLQGLARNSMFRSDGRAWFVLLGQSYLNFSCVQMKCGLNLKPFRDSGSLQFWEVLTTFGELCDRGRLSFDRFVRIFYDEFEVKFANRNSSTTSILVIDDLSALLSLGVSLVDMNTFIQKLRIRCAAHNVKLLIQSYQDDDQEDEQLARLLSLLKASSSLWMHVSKMETGYSKSLDGSLTITDQLANQQKRFLFKCTERTARLQTPGFIA